MAQFSALSNPFSASFPMLAEIHANVAARRKRYETYRRTLSELSALSAQDLADCGFSRADIRRLATEAIYGDTRTPAENSARRPEPGAS